MATITNSLSTNGIAVVLQSQGGALSIGTAANATVVTLGNVTGASAVNINTGTAGHTVTTTNGVFTVITGSGVIDLGQSATTGAINIGNSSAGALALASGANSTITITNASLGIQTGTGALNLNTAATANITTLGNVTGASAVNINTGTAGHTVTTTNGIITMVSGTGTVSISNDATNTTVNVATGAGAKLLTLGSASGASAVTINTGSAGITIPSFTTSGALVSTSSGLITDASASTSGFVLTSNGSGSAPSFQSAPASGFQWANTTGATQAMAVSTGYVSNDGATLVTFTLPATAAVGAEVAVLGSGSGLWTVAQNSGQTIHFNAVASTTGTGGSVSSTSQYDSITLICNVANTDWVAYQATGNLSVV